MKVTRLPDVERRPRRVAVGTFDGVHVGHRRVIEGSDTVLTFEPHPLAVVHPEALPKLLTPLAVKADLVAELGVEELVVIPFDKEWAARSAEEFVDDVLVDALQATRVSVGDNFRFGHKAGGDAAMLQADPRFDTRVVEMVEIDGETVSSTHVRGLVLAGEVDQAARFLGAPFQMRGEVAHGDKRGRELGFPTANVVPDDRLAYPGHGVYAALAGIDGEAATSPAAVNVGVRPTFDTGRGLLVEAYLLDFEADIYGAELRLDFLERLRGEKAFHSAEALVEQMHRDVEQARDICERAAASPDAA